MADTWTDRLSEYVDGELPQGELHALEAHLAACSECASLAAELAEVKRRADRLTDRPPPADLWAGIAARLTPRGTRAHAGAPSRRRLRAATFSLPQLAAAVLASLLLGAGAVWLAARPQPGPLAEGPPRTPSALVGSAEGERAGAYEAAIRELERQLHDNAEGLDPATVRAIESSLVTIDRAIGQARRALENDPKNPYLSRHLNQAMARKVELLRRATALSQT